jgi:tetratricopeptide (TPR) repeat protein
MRIQRQLLKRVLQTVFLLSSATISCSAASAATPEEVRQAITANNEGMVLVNNGDFQEAADKFETACRLEPERSLFHCNYGFALLKLGKIDDAIKQLEESVKLQPDFSRAWANLGVAYESKGDTVRAIPALKKVVEIGPPSAEVDRIKAHIDLLSKENEIGGIDNSETDYVESIKARNKFRWAKSRMPIKVFIKSGDGVENFRPEYESYLRDAFEQWVSASNGLISVDFVKKAKDADITTEWTTDTSGVLNLSELGDTRYKCDGQGMATANIRMLLLDPKPAKLTPAMVQWGTLHEVGHALGLLGHSRNPGDIMFSVYPANAASPKLTARDTATIQKFYAEDIGDTWLSLNDAGNVAVKSGDYLLAIQQYEKSVALKPDSNIPIQNLIRANYNQALHLLRKGDMIGPEDYFKRALELERTQRDENYPTIMKAYSQYLKMVGRTKEASELEKSN